MTQKLTRRTVVFQKKDRIMPVDHLADILPERWEKLQVGEDFVYRAARGDSCFERWRHT